MLKSKVQNIQVAGFPIFGWCCPSLFHFCSIGNCTLEHPLIRTNYRINLHFITNLTRKQTLFYTRIFFIFQLWAVLVKKNNSPVAQIKSPHGSTWFWETRTWPGIHLIPNYSSSNQVWSGLILLPYPCGAQWVFYVVTVRGNIWKNM